MKGRNLAAGGQGIDQLDRMLPALADGYFNVDEMTFEDLLAASVEFAAELKYIGPNLNVSGDWRSFLAANEIAIMAIIINRDTDQLHKRAEACRAEGVAAQASLLYELLQDWNNWLTDLKRSKSVPARDLCAKLENIVRSTLRKELRKVEQLRDDLQGGALALPASNIRQLADIWGELEASESGSLPRNAKHQKESSPAQVLANAAFEFITATEHLKAICRELLPVSMKTQSHDPAISLFITFLKLYRYAQDNLNSFTARHLDYYYQKILRVQFRKKSLESVVVNLATAASTRELTIEQGRRFSCLKDERLRDVVFEAEEELRVTDAQVRALHTLRFEREPMITPECDMNLITRIHRQQIPLEIVRGEDGAEWDWPLFGDGVSRRHPGDTDNDDWEIGLAVASKVLFLEEGYRKISLALSLRRADKPLSSYLEKLEHATQRTDFRNALYALLWAWIADDEHKDWAAAVSARTMEQIEETAHNIDRRAAVSIRAGNTAASLTVRSCHALLIEAVELLQQAPTPELPFLMRAQQAETALEFRDALGSLVVHHLLENGNVDAVSTGALDDRARELGCEVSLESIKRELAAGSSRLFKNYFGNAFRFQLSVEDGWLAIDRYDVRRSKDNSVGMNLVLSLSADNPPVVACDKAVHGDQWQSDLPIIKMTFNAEASINAYSLLEDFCLERLTVAADVFGARNIVAYNNISQLDPSKPFYPFGPLPSLSSYLAIASPEAAKKQVTDLTIHLQWGDLPSGEDGFDGHYKGYSTKFRNASFSGNVSVLSNGSWQPQSLAQTQNVALFTWRDKKLCEQQSIRVEAADYLRPIDMDAEYDELDLGLKTRNGFIKLALATPDSGFGHHEYPVQLSGTLESNAKKRVKKKSKLPNAPYTPLLNRISIDYSASSTLSMNRQSKAHKEKHPEKVFRLHPFGAEKIYPSLHGGAVSLLKPFDRDGNLLIGLSAQDIGGLITIYFSLSDDSQRSKASVSNDFHWSYLGKSGWTPLSSNRIVNDGTKGFLCSGIITFDLPADMCKQHSDMPEALYWLKVGSNVASSNFCSLRRAKTHALKLRRCADDGAHFDPLSAAVSKIKWQAVKSIPGLLPIEQIDNFRNVDQDETRTELLTRVSERIRHRARAVNPWDYERLILEEFPIVGKVMCLPNRSIDTLDPVPGNLLLIVTPRVVNPADAVGKLPRLSAVHLNDIRNLVAQFCPAAATIEVSNPVFEWVQVRCTAIFDQHAKEGMYIDQLDDDISRFLNPWDSTGYGLQFSRPVKREDLYSYIYNLDYIRYLTDFSMLHISRSSSGFYQLGDTVHQEITGTDSDVTPHYPWSLLVPLRKHYIEVSNTVEPITPDVTGIRELEIGSTFIIGGL